MPLTYAINKRTNCSNTPKIDLEIIYRLIFFLKKEIYSSDSDIDIDTYFPN